MYFFDVKITIFAAGVLAFIYLVFFCHKPESGLKSVIKTGSVALLMLAGFLAGANSLLVLGLGFSTLGDFLLSRDRARLFLAGVGAFALAHVSYIALFLTTHGAALSALSAMEYILVAGVLIHGAAMMRLMQRHAGEMKNAVIGYVPIILAMGVAALMLPAGYGVVVVGAFLFMLSDSLLALQLFVFSGIKHLERPFSLVVWASYWLAQAFILLGYPVVVS